MRMMFCGAIGRVTGSCTWLQHDNGREKVNFLVDCGAFQGDPNEVVLNNNAFQFEPKKLHFVLLTHAHLDHCGLIPRLYREGFIGPIYCTAATARLAREICLDSASIMKKNGQSIYDLFNVEMMNFKPIDGDPRFKWGYQLKLDNGLRVAINRSSHILGSVSFHISWLFNDNWKSITFSGDVGNNTADDLNQPLLKHRHSPNHKSNFIVMESTYGGRKRKDDNSFETRIDRLETVIRKTLLDQKGHLIIPTFSMQRTQEILFDLYYAMAVRFQAYSLSNQLGAAISKRSEGEDINSPKCIRRKIKLEEYKQIISDSNLSPLLKERVKRIYTPVAAVEKSNTSLISELDGLPFELYKHDVNTRWYYQLPKEDSNFDMFFNFCVTRNILQFLRLRNSFVKMVDNGITGLAFFKALANNRLDDPIRDVPPITCYCDSPLGSKISKIFAMELTKSSPTKDGLKNIYRNHNIEEWLNSVGKSVDEILDYLLGEDERHFGLHSIKYCPSKKFSMPSEPSIIITSSGMCDAGPILSKLKEYVSDSKNTILLNGYQCAGTNGHRLSILAGMSDEEKAKQFLKVSDEATTKYIPLSDVKAKVEFFSGYSGHADQDSMLKYLFVEEDKNHRRYSIPTIFLNHGDDQARDLFKAEIESRSKMLIEKYPDLPPREADKKHPYSTSVILPQPDSGWYDLDAEEWIGQVDEPEIGSQLNAASSQHIESLTKAIAGLTKAIELLTERVSALDN